VLDEAIFIYDLSMKDSLIRINVYVFSDIIKSFPAQLTLNTALFWHSEEELRRKRTELVLQEKELSTKLATDSFNYDFHLRNFYTAIVFDKKVEYNLSKLMMNL